MKKDTLKKTIKHIRQKSLKAITMVGLLNTLALRVYADPQIITGTKKLLTDASGWLTGIIALAGGLWLGFNALQYSMADDEAVKGQKKQAMKRVGIGTIIAASSSGLITFLLSYYS